MYVYISCTRAQGSSAQMQCLNVHALGEQYIEKVSGVRISQSEQKGAHLEGEHCGRSSVYTAGMVTRAKTFC